MEKIRTINLDTNVEEKEMTTQELLQWQVDTYNNSEGDLNIVDQINCPICKNKGWLKAINEENNIVAKRCKCLKKREIVQRALKSGLGEYIHKKLQDFEVWNEQSDKVKQMAVNFMTNHSEDNTWFIALGQSGGGKTLISSIICNYMLIQKGRTISYVTWTDFISKLKRDVMGDQTNEVTKYLEEIKNVDVLFLDELIKKYNETDLRYLIEIINYRYTNDLKTIITCERDINELLDIDEATFGRAIEKCNGFLFVLNKDRKINYRLKNVCGF